MPAGGGAAATQISGGPEVIDLKVCMSLLKKTIVLFPLLIMIVIFLVRAYLTTDTKAAQLLLDNNKKLNQSQDSIGINWNSSIPVVASDNEERISESGTPTQPTGSSKITTSRIIEAIRDRREPV